MTQVSLNIEQRGFEYGVKHILSPTSGPLIEILAAEAGPGLGHAEIQALLNLGAIYVDSKRALAQDLYLAIEAKTYLRVHTKPRRFPANDHLWKKRILFEDSDFVVINKPSALPCHPTVDNIQENILSYMRDELGQNFFLTHRLDVPTNGLLVLAKKQQFQSQFNRLLQERRPQKIYRASCITSASSGPELGLYRHYMVPSPRAPKKVLRENQVGHALCELEVLSRKSLTIPEEFQIYIRLLTGRTHQIRAQLSFEGHPIRGDHSYGAPKLYTEDRIDLTACELSFQNPLTKESHHFILE